MMNNGLVDGLGMVALAMVDVMGFSIVRVLDIHDCARVLVSHGVGHSLETAVWEGDMVTAIGGVSVPLFVGAKLHWILVAVVGIDAIFVLVLGRAVLWFMVAAAVVRGMVGQGEGHEGGQENKYLKQKNIM